MDEDEVEERVGATRTVEETKFGAGGTLTTSHGGIAQ